MEILLHNPQEAMELKHHVSHEIGKNMEQFRKNAAIISKHIIAKPSSPFVKGKQTISVKLYKEQKELKFQYTISKLAQKLCKNNSF